MSKHNHSHRQSIHTSDLENLKKKFKKVENLTSNVGFEL